MSDKNYEVIYLDNSLDPGSSVCRGNGSVVTLDAGPRSAVIIRLVEHYYNYRPFTCSITIRANPQTLAGLTAVVEEMDLREYKINMLPFGELDSITECVDYVELYEAGREKNTLCGTWSSFGMMALSPDKSPRQNLVGYCAGGPGSDCEAGAVHLNVAIGANPKYVDSDVRMGNRRRRGFSIVVSGYRNPTYNYSLPTELDEGACDSTTEFMCPNIDRALLEGPRCVWKDLHCDSHANCGFIFNHDEGNCTGLPSMSSRWGATGEGSHRLPWTFSTMTLLIITYLASIVLLVMVTMLFLRWHRGLDPPGSAGNAEAPEDVMPAEETAERAATAVLSQCTAAGGIMFVYKPPGVGCELPPTYESLFASAQANSEVAADSGDSPDPPPSLGSSSTEAGVLAVSLPVLSADPSREGGTTTLLDPSWTCAAIAEALAAANLPVPDDEHLEELQRQIQLVQDMHLDAGQREDAYNDGDEQERIPLTAEGRGGGSVDEVLSAAASGDRKCECACEHHVEPQQVL